MSKNQADHCRRAQRWRAVDRFFQKFSRIAAPPEFFIDVNTELNRAPIRAAWQETFEAQHPTIWPSISATQNGY